MTSLLAPRQVIQAIVETYGNARYAFEPNGGNLGDILISAGCICALDQSGVQWSMLNGRPLNSPSFDVLIYGGGGNLVPNYDGAAQFLKKAAASGKPVVILPHTIRSHPDLLGAMTSGIIFCRDQASCDFASSHTGIPIHFAADMATAVDMTQFGLNSIAPLRAAARSACPQGTYVLKALRMDSESQHQAGSLPPDNVDLSVVVGAVGSVKSSILTQASLFLSTLSLFDSVVSDRLHVVIGRLLTKGPVHAIENNYGKLNAVLRPILQQGLLPPDLVTFHSDYASYLTANQPV